MEVMVTVGILGVVAIGSSVLFSDMFAIQKRADIGKILQQQRNAMVAALTRSNTTVVGPGAPYSSAWVRMVAEANTQNSDLLCLQNNTKCIATNPPTVPPVLVNVRDNGGSEIFNSRTATRGVSTTGDLCNSFSASSPDPTCPFRWVVEAHFLCVGGNKTDCENPTVRFVGTLLYSPGGNPAFGTSFNTAMYGFDVRRGDKPDLNIPIRISYVEDDNSGETGSGTCKQTWVPRALNTLVDPQGNVTAFNSNKFTLSVGGYDCRVQVPAFKNGTNKIRMRGTSAAFTFTSQSGVASLTGGSALLTLQATFVLTAPMTFGIEQTCTHNPSEGDPAGSLNNAFSLGVPVGDSATGYNNVVYTVVSCVKTS